jgi:hypothetical protein
MLQKADLMSQAKSKFVDIRPPVNIDKKSPGPADSLLKETSQIIQSNNDTAGPRFNYDDYMKSLTDKISGSAPNANAHIGNDFQSYISKERESYLKSIHTMQTEGANLVSA